MLTPDSKKGYTLSTSSVERAQDDLMDGQELAEIGNILADYPEEDVMNMGRVYAEKHGLDADLFAKAAAVARNPLGFNSMNFLSEEEKIALNEEEQHPYRMAPRLIGVIALGSMAAAVQGMDQSVINGATLFYPKAFNILDMAEPQLIEGLINGSPYLCCGVIACWLSDSCNRRLGRKWTIFWTCLISGLTCFWQGFVNNWYHLLISRFMLGFGVGIKSATVPAYAAECTPKRVRGSLVMLWQFFTAVGIMFGYVASLAFYYVPDRGISGGLNWRLMLGSAGVPAIIVLAQVPFVPESPRWLMGKDRHPEAFASLLELRKHKLTAARDCFYQQVLLAEEGSYRIPTLKRFREMFTKRRNRNGAIGAFIVMFMQQFCGINVIAYYSSSVFVESGFSEISAMLASWGFGMLNFIFAIPALYTIDTFGRRFLLLMTFPLMAVFLMMTAGGFWIPNTDEHRDARLGVIVTGVYLFACVYSSGEGPVPFTYSAEAFPLYIRDLGMSFATATCWFFNFVLAFTWPKLVIAFKPQGAFGWYAAWNVVGFFLVLWFLPETKGLTLEELDEVFDVPMSKHASWQMRQLVWNFQTKILRRNIPPQEPLYRHHRLALRNKELQEKPEALHVEKI